MQLKSSGFSVAEGEGVAVPVGDGIGVEEDPCAAAMLASIRATKLRVKCIV
jgi:hypothetical protein